MNMILHNNPTALIVQGNTLTDPKYRDGQGGNASLKTFDYVVANPPFSDKRWSTGLDPLNDPYERFKAFGVPPNKQGDYAYLLHIVRTLRSTGKGACILPHGVLFRGNAEADIRRALVRKGYLKGIIGLPPNLFYGTGIPACIVVVDKQDAHARKGIFMIDASRGFMKDGPKNRLRSQDIHKIVDVFNKRLEVPRYARMVSVEEIEKNDFNLNLPRYIVSQTPEDMQDIEGHLRGGIPEADVDALASYWAVCPQLRNTLFTANRPGYLDLAVNKADLKSTIYGHPEFAAFIADMQVQFDAWRDKSAATLKAIDAGCNPKQVIFDLSEDLLASYTGKPLIAHYDVYQHLMDYWAETMQDDCYSIAADGWKAETTRIIERDKKGKEKDKGWTCDLIPKRLIVARYYAEEQKAIDQLALELETVAAMLAELEEEHGGEEGAFPAPDKVNKASVTVRLKELKEEEPADLSSSSFPRKRGSRAASKLDARRSLSSNAVVRGGHDSSLDAPEAVLMVAEAPAPYGDAAPSEAEVLRSWLNLFNQEADLKKRLKDAEAALDAKAYAHYPKLTEAEIKALVVDDKWLAALDAAIHGEMERVSQQLTGRMKELAERYEAPLPQMVDRVAELEARVNGHLERMGFAWSQLKQGAMQELLTGKKRLPGANAEWEQKRLGDVLTIAHGKSQHSVADRNGAYPILATGGQIGTASRFLYDKPSVLIGRKGTIDKLQFMDSPFWTVDTLFYSIVHEPHDAKFLYYRFCLIDWKQHNEASGVPSLNAKTIESIELTMPQYQEQTAIAAILSDMDAELAALEAKLAKARAVKQGMMQALLTGKIRLGNAGFQPA